jgi:hypothetical protein
MKTSGGTTGERAHSGELEPMCSSSIAHTQERWDMEDVCGQLHHQRYGTDFPFHD